MFDVHEPPYSAAKAAVINLTRTAAIELAKDTIRVNCICAGLINTPLVYAGIPGGETTTDPLPPSTAIGSVVFRL